MPKPIYEVISGGLGSGKSEYALSTVNNKDTFVLGAGTKWFEPLNLRFGSINRHIREVEIRGFQHQQNVRPWTMAWDVNKITHPVVLVDEWTTFRHYTLFWNRKRILITIDQIFAAINRNPNIMRVVFVCSNCAPYLPFSLYKKTVLWNKILFKEADKITNIHFGVPVVIKSKN